MIRMGLGTWPHCASAVGVVQSLSINLIGNRVSLMILFKRTRCSSKLGNLKGFTFRSPVLPGIASQLTRIAQNQIQLVSNRTGGPPRISQGHAASERMFNSLRTRQSLRHVIGNIYYGGCVRTQSQATPRVNRKSVVRFMRQRQRKPPARAGPGGRCENLCRPTVRPPTATR